MSIKDGKNKMEKGLPKVIYSGKVMIGQKELSCAVLDDETRILTNTAIFQAFDRPRKGKPSEEYRLKNVPAFLTANNLKPYIDRELADDNSAGVILVSILFSLLIVTTSSILKLYFTSCSPTFGEKFLPRDAFDALCASPQGICSVYQMMQSMEPSVQTDDADAKNLSDAELRRMMRDPKYWRDHDPEYVRKIENGFKKLYS